MISKPPSNWSNEDRVVTAAQSAVAVAQFAGGATKRGFSLVKAVGLGVMAALWGFGGLMHLVIGGGLGGAPQAASGIMILLMAAIPGYFAWRNLSKAFGWDAPRPPALPREADTGWRQQPSAPFGFDRNGNGAQQFAPQPPAFNTPRGGERHDVPNSQASLIKSLLLGIGLIPLGYYVAQAPKPLVSLVGLFILFCGPLVLFKTLRIMIGGAAAFSYDGEGITMPGWFGEKHLAWREIADFSVKTVSTYAYGFVKVGSRHQLYALKTDGGKKLLPTQFTGLDAEGLSHLAILLEHYRSGLAGTAPRVSQDYSQAAPPLAPAPSPAFGRIDTGLVSSVPFASHPGPAAAPSFGRRQSGFGNR
jgi:hypothetical protein